MIEDLLYQAQRLETLPKSPPRPAGYHEPGDLSAVDELLNQKTRILEVKLGVFAAGIVERLRIRTINHARIDRDEERMEQTLATVDRQARYHLREHHDKRVLYEILFDLREQRRAQDSECWRDIMEVLREALLVWESLAQARSRSVFLDHARR